MQNIIQLIALMKWLVYTVHIYFKVFISFFYIFILVH